jgi:hypothetical protein
MNLGGSLYVAYAQVGPQSDENEGPGLGYVSKFDTNGNFVARLVSNGPLDAPWGMAIAAGFGTFAGAADRRQLRRRHASTPSTPRPAHSSARS